MNFKDMKKAFIEKFGYQSEINNFESFVTCITHQEVSMEFLQGTRTQTIKESIEYNISHKGYATQSIALKYVSAIAQFFRYADMQGWFKNDNFKEVVNTPKMFSDQSYRGELTRFILSNKKLKKVNSKNTLTNEEAARLISFIDLQVNDTNLKNGTLSIGNIAAMLAIKLMLFLGLRYKIITQLSLSAVDLARGTITVNSYKLRMPINFNIQVHLYIKLRELTSFKCPNLFVDNSDNPWPKNTYSNLNYLNQCILGRTDTTGITKYGVNQLLAVGTNVSEIMNLTHVGTVIINQCLKESGIDKQNKKDQYMNIQLCKTNIYHNI